MHHFISHNGQWEPCIELLKWDFENEDWEEFLERNEFDRFPFYKVRYSDSYYVEAYAVLPGKVFETNPDIKQVVMLTCTTELYQFYCTDIRAFIVLLRDITTSISGGHVSNELEEAIAKRREAHAG